MDNIDSKGLPEKGSNGDTIVRIDKLERKISRRRNEIKELKVELAKLRQNSKLPWFMVISNIVSWVLDIQKQRGEPQASTRLPRKGTRGSRIPNAAAELHLRSPNE